MQHDLAGSQLGHSVPAKRAASTSNSDEVLMREDRVPAANSAMQILFARHQKPRLPLSLSNARKRGSGRGPDQRGVPHGVAASAAVRGALDGHDLAAGHRPLQGDRRVAAPARHDVRREHRTLSDPADDPEVALQGKHRGEILRNCLTGLSREHREIIDLVYYHEKSVQEAAEIIGIPGNTVKTRMFYARKRLSELLQTRGRHVSLVVTGEQIRDLLRAPIGSRRIEFGAFGGDRGELIRRHTLTPPRSSRIHPRFDPRTQLLVGALARLADDLADLALSYGDFALGRRRVAWQP